MKIIKLKANGTGRYDDVSPFIVTDNRLELQVEFPNFNGEFYFVYEINGETNKKLLFCNGQIVLENLSAGVLHVEIKHYVKGEFIKAYKIEPLLLKEVDGTLSALPEIEELNRHISAIERTFEEYKQSAAEREKEHEEAFCARLEEIENNLLALVRFAFKDYCENVYLAGGSFENFKDEFGFSLTDEQIKTIKGEN